MTRFEIYAPDHLWNPERKVRVGVVEARKDLTNDQAQQWAKQIASVFGVLYDSVWIECNVGTGCMDQREVRRQIASEEWRMFA